MFRTWAPRYVLPCLLAATVATAAQAQETRKLLEKLAGELPILATQHLLVYGRGTALHANYYHIPPEWGEAHNVCFDALRAAKAPAKDLAALLRHKDPKVRSLALVALFQRHEPKYLPQLHALVNDKAETFPAPDPDDRAKRFPGFDPVRDEIKVTPQTVGDVSALAVNVYLQAARLGSPPGERPDVADFEKYWAERRERSHCLSWFVVRFERASQWAVSEEGDALLRGLRADIDRLPPADRAWTLLALMGRAIGRPDEERLGSLVRRDELVKMCQSLGQAKLLDLLAGKRLTGDPDLAPAAALHHYWTMQHFVLRQAKELFEKDSDARLLDAYESNPDGIVSPWWRIAAAELRPAEAMAHLQTALKEWDGEYHGGARAEIAGAVWRLAGLKESTFLRDWFFGERARPGFEPHSAFLAGVFKERPKENRAFLAELVRDERLAGTDWHTLVKLIEGLNRWTKSEIVPGSELRDLRHPNGSYHFVLNLPGERDRYPEETAVVLRTLEDWRGRVRGSVPAWRGGK